MGIGMTEEARSGGTGQGSGTHSDALPRQIAVSYERALVDPVTIFPETCTGCNRCVNVCPVDLFLPSPERGGAPLVVFPGECWFEGSCVDICPEPGAIVLNRPFVSRVNWKVKGESCVNSMVARRQMESTEIGRSGLRVSTSGSHDASNPRPPAPERSLDSPDD